jgi:maltose O-acetyltransferase
VILRRLGFRVAASDALPDRLRPPLLRRLGVEVGPRVVVLAGLDVQGTGGLALAEGVYLNRHCYVDATARVSIGVRVSIAPHVRIVTSGHELGLLGRRAGKRTAAPVRIGDGTWIGTAAVVLPGVTIGSGCVVSAGAVVNRDCEPDGLYAGVPARRVRDLPT